MQPVTLKTRLARAVIVRWLLRCSRGAFALSFLLAMMTSDWDGGLFASPVLLELDLAGDQLSIGRWVLLPFSALALWAAARLLEMPRRRWRRGPAHIALPVIGLGALALIRAWPVHVPRIAAVAVTAIGVFWGAYLYVLQDWPRRWAVATLAALLCIQGGIASAQFLRQGSIGLWRLGEARLDPETQGVSVIQTAGRRWVRAYGLSPHPNMLGGYLSMSLLICGSSVVAAAARRRLWLWLPLGLGTAGLFFSFSRAAWLATSLGLMYVAMMARPWRQLNWSVLRTKAVTLIFGLALIGIVLLLLSTYSELLATRFLRLGDPLEARSIGDRFTDVGQAWSLIRTLPVQGTGSGYYLGALWAQAGEERPPGFRKVHNVALLAAAEMGSGGALLWLWLLLSPPILLVRWSHSATPSLQQAGWAAAFVSALVLGMLDNYLYVPSTWWAALYMGVCSGMWARIGLAAKARVACLPVGESRIA
jgi:hypothetical protein